MITSWVNDDVLISNVMLGAALLILLGALRVIARTRKWTKRLVSTSGEIVSVIEGEDDSGVTYRAVYRYAGIETDMIGGNQTLNRRPAIGERATIFYDPSYPSNAFFEGSKAFWMFPGCLVFAGLAMLAGAILVRFDSSW